MIRSLSRSTRLSSRSSLRTTSSRSFSTDSKSFALKNEFKTHNCDGPKVNSVTATKSELLEYYRTMVLFRRFEIVADTLYKSKYIRGFCHLYDGQEAIVTGTEAAVKKTDSIITAYREHCDQLGRGDTAGSVMAELLGKATGCSKGKGGSMHMYYPKNHFYGGNGIVGAQIPLGAGLAFAHKFRKDGGIAITKYGDGAANQGQIYEAANMAALWKLPLIFLCENNQYGMGTSAARAAKSPEFYKRGHYIPGLWIDGMDVLAVREGMKWAAEWCRSGNGPLFVEMHTYRYHGHSMSDPGITYRTREEINAVRTERDCIERVKNRILDAGWATAADLKAIDKQVRVEVDEAVKFAQESKGLPLDDLYSDIYHGSPPPYIRAVNIHKSKVQQ